MTRHVSSLRELLDVFPARQWKIEIDRDEISGPYILWEAMNIRSVGPALYLASRAKTRDAPSKKDKPKHASKIKIAVRPSALLILRSTTARNSTLPALSNCLPTYP